MGNGECGYGNVELKHVCTCGAIDGECGSGNVDLK